MKDTVLIIGASGQIGTELVITLRKIYGDANVIATDIRPMANEELSTGPFEVLDIMDQKSLFDIVKNISYSSLFIGGFIICYCRKNIELAGV